MELGAVQEDLVNTKENQPLSASALSHRLRFDKYNESKGLADRAGRLEKVRQLIIHAMQLDKEAFRKRVDWESQFDRV